MKWRERAAELLNAERLLALASLSTVLGLLFMVLPNFVRAPLFVMLGMSLGHVFGLVGVLFFAASVLREVLTRSPPDVSRPRR